MSKKLSLLLPLLVSSALAQTVPAAPTVTLSGPAPTPAQAQKLAERLLLSNFGPGSQAEVTYGLPAALPLKLPAPFEVAATVRAKYPGNGTAFYRVFASAPLGASAARDTLQAQLTAQGWKMQQSGQPIGFEGNYQPNFLNFYREGSTPFALNANIIGTGSGAGDSSNVEIVLNPIGQQQLAQLKKQPNYMPRSSLPLLRALPGSKSAVKYPATGPSGSLSSVWVQTDKAAGEVFNHYSAQLKAAGWKALTDTTTGPLRVVTYGLTDLNGREALGTLGIRPWEKDGGYVLTVSVQGFKP